LGATTPFNPSTLDDSPEALGKEADLDFQDEKVLEQGIDVSDGIEPEQNHRQAASARGVGKGDYIVKQGDCIESIAYKHGLLGESIWNDPRNAELNRIRMEPNALLPGDRVHIRIKQEKQIQAATEQRHTFRRLGVPSRLCIRLILDNRIRANEPYTLQIDKNLISGITDAEGKIQIAISPNARSGKLIIGPDQEEYELDLGHIDPIGEISGIQGRLNNLGFFCGEAKGILSSETQEALRKFQKTYKLPESGEPDEATRQKIVELHGS